MHESTISRVTTNKYVHTPQGLFELKYFFNSSIHRVADEDIASREREAGDQEDHRRRGQVEPATAIRRSSRSSRTRTASSIARRTVAKYREMLGILARPSARRCSRPAPQCGRAPDRRAAVRVASSRRSTRRRGRRRRSARSRATDANPAKNPHDHRAARRGRRRSSRGSRRRRSARPTSTLDFSDASVHRLGAPSSLARGATRGSSEKIAGHAAAGADGDARRALPRGVRGARRTAGSWQVRRPPGSRWCGSSRGPGVGRAGAVSVVAEGARRRGDRRRAPRRPLPRARGAADASTPRRCRAIAPAGPAAAAAGQGALRHAAQAPRAHLPELRSVGDDFPSPERVDEMGFSLAGLHAGRATVGCCCMHGAGARGRAPLLARRRRLREAAYLPADKFPAHVRAGRRATRSRMIVPVGRRDARPRDALVGRVSAALLTKLRPCLLATCASRGSPRPTGRGCSRCSGRAARPGGERDPGAAARRCRGGARRQALAQAGAHRGRPPAARGRAARLAARREELARRHNASWGADAGGRRARADHGSLRGARAPRRGSHDAAHHRGLGGAGGDARRRRIELWPRALARRANPFARHGAGTFDSVCPGARSLLVGLFEAGELWTSVALRRTERGLDLVLGPDEVRADMGLLAGDWRRDCRHLARAVEDRAGRWRSAATPRRPAREARGGPERPAPGRAPSRCVT